MGTNSLLLKMIIYSGFTHKKKWFSIAMLDDQRVNDTMTDTQ